MIKNVDFQQTVETAFLKYGASVAQERALPDVRDFLKIGLRQGLYAQYTNKLTHKDKFQKAQKSVAAAMSQSYVHGDVAMYDSFIRAARPWSSHYPLEDVQGSYGNPSSPDSHAAARYVEMKSSAIADYLFAGLKKDAIHEWYWNYDDSEQIPSVFPSIGYWNIVNGCSGIAVALATSCPQFNLAEVNDALIKIIKNPNIPYDEIYCAPDFATGGIIINGVAVKESLRYGKGESIRLRAKLQYNNEENMIQATELPYSVFTNTIIEQLAELTQNNPNYGIERVIDHTKKVADIRIYLSKGVNPNKMIEKLYHDTSLENWFSVNMVLLDKGRFPRIFGWREACDAYIAHIRECERNIIQYDLDKALARLNIVEGLLIAAASIDEIVTIIRGSENTSEAEQKLIARFNFNQEQVKAILAIKLASLTKIDAIKLNDEKAELIKKIETFQHLLKDSIALDEELIKMLEEVKNKFGDKRRTSVINVFERPIEEVQEIQEQEVTVMLFDNNMLRLVKREDIQEGKRGRKGSKVKAPKNANLINTIYTTNLDTLSAFTNRGRMYNFHISELEYDQDYSIYELASLQDNEVVKLLIETTSLHSYINLITVSKHGYIKKSSITEYNTCNKKGIAAVKLETNDSLVNVFLSRNNEDYIFIASNNGYYNYYSLNEISITGRVTKGVKAIKLSDNSYVVAATIVRNNIEYQGLLSITNSGKGKITSLEEYNPTSRGIKGTQIMALKDEQLAAVYAVPLNQETIFVSAANKVILLDICQVPVQGKNTNGVRIIDARESNTNNIEVI